MGRTGFTLFNSSTNKVPVCEKHQKLRIHLNFKDPSTFPEEKINELIIDQGKKLKIADWELFCLIDLCKSKNCLSQGLEVLFEYADNPANAIEI